VYLALTGNGYDSALARVLFDAANSGDCPLTAMIIERGLLQTNRTSFDAGNLHVKYGLNFAPVLLLFSLAPGVGTVLVPQANAGHG
jgi:hypothetical protein